MLRILFLSATVFTLLWAPWLNTPQKEKEVIKTVFDAFGPLPGKCYDDKEHVLQDGVVTRWYPLGRLVHTCAGDYVVWMWGAVQELGGVYKRAEDMRAVQSRPLTCSEVLERQESRRGTSTDATITYYTGEPATHIDTSIFPDAEARRQEIEGSLSEGVNFAGRFRVTEWGCGLECHALAITDVETGLVIAYDVRSAYGFLYTPNSTVLITNPVHLLPQLPQTAYETESLALSIARIPREYYRLTTDTLSGTQYLVRECVEGSATGYIEVEDDRIGLITNNNT